MHGTHLLLINYRAVNSTIKFVCRYFVLLLLFAVVIQVEISRCIRKELSALSLSFFSDHSTEHVIDFQLSDVEDFKKKEENHKQRQNIFWVTPYVLCHILSTKLHGKHAKHIHTRTYICPWAMHCLLLAFFIY